MLEGLPPNGASHVMLLTCDEGRARAVADAIVETFDPTETAAAAFATTAVTAATTFTATAETTTAWGTGFHGACFVDHQVATTQRCAVHAGDGSLRFGIAAHFDETKTF